MGFGQRLLRHRERLHVENRQEHTFPCRGSPRVGGTATGQDLRLEGFAGESAKAVNIALVRIVHDVLIGLSNREAPGRDSDAQLESG